MNKPICILYVDDHPLDRELVRDVLEKESGRFRVIEATTRIEFKARLADGDYDLILSDFNSLGFKGLQVLDAVRAKDPNVPVVIITGSGSEEIAVEAMKRSVTDYVIKKPEHIQGLPHIIEAAIEKKRRQAEESLTEEHHLLRTLIDNLPDYIYVKDTKSRFIAGNFAMAHIIGATTPDELIGKTDFDFYPPELARQFYDNEQEVIRSGQAVVNCEESTIDSNGNEGWISTTKMPLRDNQGEIVGLVAMDRDITKRKQFEEQFRQSQKMEAIGRLASGVAHDFNNLLTTITGYSDLLLQRHFDNHDPSRRDIKQIKMAGERAALLTRQLLAFSRQQVLQPKRLDLNHMVADIKNILYRLIGEEIDLAIIPGQGPSLVNIDPGQIEQIIINLALNARDAMPQGGQLTIETANVNLDEVYTRRHVDVEPGPYVMLATSDTGNGMAEEIQARIFEPFFTTKETGKGTGLGLAIVYGIVKQSGGHIRVHSQPGQGTTFKIYLPRVKETVKSIGGGQSFTSSAQSLETILLVENEDTVRELVSNVLLKNGYTVLAASHGAEALQICKQHQGPIHLLLTNLIMPGRMDGRQLAKHLASRQPEIKVLYMSDYVDETIAHHQAPDSGTAFLEKPFSPNVLALKIHEILDGPYDILLTGGQYTFGGIDF